MPGTSIAGNINIAVLDLKVVVSLCNGTICMDVSPSVWLGSGKDDITGATFKVVNPFGVTIKDYDDDMEVAPDLSGGMDAPVCINIPTQAGNYQYGKYTITAKLFDGTDSWEVTKTVTICQPDKNNKNKNYGSLSAQLIADCKAGTMTVLVDGVPTYNGKLVESQENDFTLEYPTSSELPKLETTIPSFTTTLFEGVYKITGEICATYNYGDSVYVDVKYKVKKEKNIRCLLDECCVFTQLSYLHKQIDSACTDKEKADIANTVLDALRLLTTAKIAGQCGEDPSEYIEALEKLLGCQCTCNCADGTPVIDNSPASNISIEGCNVGQQTVGLTTVYTIENYEYVVSVTENGGILVIADPVLGGCIKTQQLTFNISAAYTAIKSLANANSTEASFWSSVINKVLDSLDPGCLGSSKWTDKTFEQRMQNILTKLCECCGCGATIETYEAACSGGDVVLTFKPSANTYSVQVWWNGVLKDTLIVSIAANPVSGIIEYAIVGGADGNTREWMLVPFCSNKTQGTPVSGEASCLGCPEIAPPNFTVDSITDATCPFDLTTITDPSNPVGLTIEWHNANNSLPSSLVANPQAVSSGIYYAFHKNGDGCYSNFGTQFTLICSTESSCTAPQNLQVEVFGSDLRVKFQSAAYPPPGNSYTVKRKLASDPDVDGSYTTLGTPTWNSSINRWVILDTTALDNVLYTWKAQSNCGDSPETTPSVSTNYANIVCPVLDLTPGSTTIDYSFTSPGGSIDKIEVKLFDSSGTVQLDVDTYEAEIPEVVSGTFEYLDPETIYKVQVKIYIGVYSKTCVAEAVQTTA